MEHHSLCKTVEFPERNLGKVLGQGVNRHRAALALGGHCRKVIASSVPGNDLDSGPDCDPDKNTCVFKLGARSGPLASRLLTGSCGWLLTVGCVAEASSENITACLVKCRRDARVWRNHQEDILTRRSSKDKGILGWSPADGIDWVFTAQLHRPYLPAGQQLPYAHSAVTAACSQSHTGLLVISILSSVPTYNQRKTYRVNRDTSYRALVAAEDGLDNGREWLQLSRRRKLGKKRVGVNVEPVFPHTGSKIKVHAPFESLLDQSAPRRYLAKRVELLREELLLAVLRVSLLPLFAFFLCSVKLLVCLLGNNESDRHLRQVLLRRIVTHFIARRWELRRRNVHRIWCRWLLILPKIELNLLLLFLLSFTLLRWLVRKDSAFTNGADQFHHLLSLVLGWQEAPLWFGGRAEGCFEVSYDSVPPIDRRVLTHRFLLGSKPFDGIGIWVITLVRNKTMLDTTDQLQLLLCKIERVSGVDVGQTSPALGDLNGIEKTLQRIASGWAHNLLAIDVVADVWVAVVEAEWDVSYRVNGALGI